MLKVPLHYHVHFDQFIFTARVNYREMHDILADAFGKGAMKRKEVNGKHQWGMNFSGTSIWCSRYENKFGYSWVALPATPDYLSILGQLAHNNELRLHLHSAEISFDFDCPGLNYAEVEILRSRLVHRMSPVNGRSVSIVHKHGDFMLCKDGTISGKKLTYLHSLNKKVLEETGIRQRGKYISLKSTIYCKEIVACWNIRVEVTLYRRKLKKEIPFLPRELERLCKLEPNYDFYDFWHLYTLDTDKFRQSVLKSSKEKQKKNNRRLNAMIDECSRLPILEQKNKMKEIARYIGSKKLEKKVTEKLNQYRRSLTLEEAFATPIHDEPIFEPAIVIIRGKKHQVYHWNWRDKVQEEALWRNGLAE